MHPLAWLLVLGLYGHLLAVFTGSGAISQDGRRHTPADLIANTEALGFYDADPAEVQADDSLQAGYVHGSWVYVRPDGVVHWW